MDTLQCGLYLFSQRSISTLNPLDEWSCQSLYLDESTFNLGVSGGYFHTVFCVEIPYANSVDPDQTLRSAASDLRLQCFHVSLTGYQSKSVKGKNLFPKGKGMLFL